MLFALLELNKMTIEKICEEEKSLMITQLIGLAEAQRNIYDKLQPEIQEEILAEAYKHHEQELNLLIKYQKQL